MSTYEQLSKEKKLELYKTMVISRCFEQKVNEMFMKGMIHGTTHLGIGQEANHAGLSGAIDKRDWLLTTHRGHGHFIGKGGSLLKMMAELFGLSDGVSSGLGGSMHMTDVENYNMGSSGIVGGAVPIAVGMAFALKKQNSQSIVVSTLGDGASNQGMSLESLNLASVWGVPLLFYCENNGYAMSSPARIFVGGGDIASRARAFGIKAETIDGNDLGQVYDSVKKAAEYIRNTKQPYFIESVTYRQVGHSKSDLRKYRTAEEEELWKQKCPILINGKYLIENNIATARELAQTERDAVERIDDCAAQCLAKKDEIISVNEALRFVYCDGRAEL